MLPQLNDEASPHLMRIGAFKPCLGIIMMRLPVTASLNKGSIGGQNK